ncbi:MAG: 30S ribosomal protein S16 [Longimicrobiales bacterium]
MSVRIRLRRVGRKKQPYFRVVVVKRDAPRDGAYIEELGFYNPRTRPAFLTLDLEKLDEWIQNGAEISDSVKSLARKARKGGDDDVVFTTPGEEAPRLKTAKKPERRPKGTAAAEGTEAPESTEVEDRTEGKAEVKAAVETEAAAEVAEPTEAQEEAETESEAAEASATKVEAGDEVEVEAEEEEAEVEEEDEDEAEDEEEKK